MSSPPPEGEHCGDTCSVVAQMASTFKDFVPPEQRMTQAIAAVQTGKMSQRAAADKFDVSRTSLQRELEVAQMGHPETSQSQPAVTPIVKESSASLPKSSQNSRLQAIRRLAVENGINKIDGINTWSKGACAIHDALIAAGIDVPDDIMPRSLLPKTSKAKSKFIPPTQETSVTNEERLHADNSVSVLTKWAAESDSEPEPEPEGEHPAFADKLDIEAVRERVNYDVQRSNQPAEFKRAVALLTELSHICTGAWYRRLPEPWQHDHWAHVSSEIRAINSIVSQRAEEEADEIFQRATAISVGSATVI